MWNLKSLKHIKKLNVPNFFKNTYWENDSNFTETIKKLDSFLKPTDPPITIGSDGWYYDRKRKRSWYEWQGLCYEARIGDFMFELNCLDIGILDQELVNAINTIHFYHFENKNFKDAIYYHQSNVMIRDIYRGLFRHVVRDKGKKQC